MEIYSTSKIEKHGGYVIIRPKDQSCWLVKQIGKPGSSSLFWTRKAAREAIRKWTRRDSHRITLSCA